MSLEDLISELEDMMDEASSVPFSKKVSVEPDDVYEILNEMREEMPEEIKQAQWVNEEKDRIISEAEAEANKRISEADSQIKNYKEEARAQYQRMINENAITQQAKQEGRRILEEANKEADEIRKKSYAYVDSLFSKSVDNFSNLSQSLEKTRKQILNEN